MHTAAVCQEPPPHGIVFTALRAERLGPSISDLAPCVSIAGSDSEACAVARVDAVNARITHRGV